MNLQASHTVYKIAFNCSLSDADGPLTCTLTFGKLTGLKRNLGHAFITASSPMVTEEAGEEERYPFVAFRAR